MDKNEDSLRSEEELDKIIPTPKNYNYNKQPFSIKNEYELNKVQNEIDSFLNISDIKNNTNDSHFFADENIDTNKKIKVPFLSQNYFQIAKNSNNKNLFEHKLLNEKFKKITNLRTNEILNTSIKNTNKQNLNIELISNEKNNKNIFNNEKYKKICAKLFLDDNKKEAYILLSSLSKRNVNNLYNGNFTPNNYNRLYFQNKLACKNCRHKKNEIIQKIKNLTYNTELSNNNYIRQNRNILHKEINKNNNINNVYTLNEISENFDRIFNKLEAKIKNKQKFELDLKKSQIHNNNFLFHNKKTSITDLNKFLSNSKNKILTIRSNTNNSLSKQNILNENKNKNYSYSSIKRTNIINLKNKSGFKLNSKSPRINYDSSGINCKKNRRIYSYTNVPYNNLKRKVLNFDFDKKTIMHKFNKINFNY